MAAVSENDSSLANKCLALCQALNSQGKAFKFSLTIGNTFSFSLDSGGRTVPLPIPKTGRKRTSPSTKKRNARRRKQFLAKKNTPASEENQADLETNQQALVEKQSFKCDQCDTVFKTSNGLKIHIGKSHKALNSPEKLRETSSESMLTVSPSREDRRAEPCPNCGAEMSPTHLCQDDDPAVEPEVVDEDKKEDSGKLCHYPCDCELAICCNCDNLLYCNCHHEQECSCYDDYPDFCTCSSPKPYS